MRLGIAGKGLDTSNVLPGQWTEAGLGGGFIVSRRTEDFSILDILLVGGCAWTN